MPTLGNNLHDHTTRIRERVRVAQKKYGHSLDEIAEATGISKELTLKPLVQDSKEIYRLSPDFIRRLDRYLTERGIGQSQAQGGLPGERNSTVPPDELDELRRAVGAAFLAEQAKGVSIYAFGNKIGAQGTLLVPFLRQGANMSRAVVDRVKVGLAGLGVTLAKTSPSLGLVAPTAASPPRSARELVESWMDEAMEIVVADAGIRP